MSRSIFLRAFTGYAFLTIVALVLIMVFTFRAFRRHEILAHTAYMRSVGDTAARVLELEADRDGQDRLDAVVKRVWGEGEMQMTLLDADGRVLARSHGSSETMGDLITLPDVRRVLRGEPGRSVLVATSQDDTSLFLTMRTTIGGRPGALRLTYPLANVHASLNGMIAAVIGTLIGFSILMVAIGFMIARGLSAPVDAVSRASRSLAAGDMERRVLLNSKGEIKELIDSFNYMADHVSASRQVLIQEVEELRSIVSSIQDGLVVLDREGRILLSNESFRQLAGGEKTDGKHYWELIRAPDFAELVRNVEAGRSNQVSEVVLGERTYLCSAAFLTSRAGVVVILHDVTELKAIERLKKDFVANLSHELRTPLTAIKGFLETLEEELPEGSAYYLTIVRRHTDRLAHIVDDLLELSELEDSGVRLEPGPVDIRSMIEDVLRIFEQRMKQKDLSVELLFPEERLMVRGDPFKLEQVFVNLIANAIKYTESGSISVSAGRQSADVVVEVADTGIGIPEEHLPRIFERFYVVDKSRSKRVGGTGLGLSIVKHIVLLHHGTVDVESTPGRGTRFRVTLPQRPLPPASS
jgi:two-component system phosphate regulon sensor histidine kinase PhoR